MPGPWITFSDLQQALADVLKKDTTGLEDYWNRIITQVLIDSTAYISTLMEAKAFTAAQIDSWDWIQVYQRDYALFLALTKGGGLGDFDPAMLNNLNRAPELKGITSISIGGIMQPPAASDGAGIETGCMEAGSIERFDRHWHREIRHNANRPV